MTPFQYGDAPLAIREDLAEAHRRAWERLARPGTWWSGAERVALAGEVRRAAACALCARRKAALSPHADPGQHEASGPLPAAAVEAVHRIATDPARLTRAWVEKLAAAGLPDTHYVEALGVTVTVFCIDAFHRALGLPLEPLPAPQPGEPTRRRPSGAAPEGAFVPMVRENRLDPADADLYGGLRRTGNVLRAMSLVPAEVRGLLDLSAAQYMRPSEMMTLSSRRALDRMQIELVAGRVSALRECFY